MIQTPAVLPASSPPRKLAFRQPGLLAGPRQVSSPAGLSDRELGVALLAKDPAAPREAWRRFAPMVRGILRRLLGPGREVEDLAQDVFLCLFTKLPSLREPGALRAFVMAIAIRMGRKQIRRARSMVCSDASLPENRSDSTDVGAEFALRRFYGVLALLRERDRTVFILRFIEGMKSEEIAQATGASISTVRRRCKRAMARVTCLALKDPFLAHYVQPQN